MKKIIVVEDDPDLRKLLVASLELDGHKVLQAGDGREALRQIYAERPHLIISGINMPRMDGVELFNTIRAESAGIQLVPFIFISGAIDESARIEHLNLGVDCCFEKPISLALLRAQVNACMANSTRHSQFMKKKLDMLARSIPAATRHDFSPFKPLADNIDEYATVISATLSELFENKVNGDWGGPNNKLENSENHSIKPLNYIRYVLKEIEHSQAIMKSTRSELLTLWLVCSGIVYLAA